MKLNQWPISGSCNFRIMNILNFFRGPKKEKPGLPYPDWQFIRDLWIPMTDDTAKYIDTVYKGNVYAHAIINHIVDKASDAPGQIYRVRDERKAAAYRMLTKADNLTPSAAAKAAVIKSQAFEEVDDHPFIELMETPNPIMSGKQLRRELMGYERITGNAYMYAAVPGVGLNATKPQQLWVIPSPCVNIVAGTRTEPVKGYKVSYFDEEMIPASRIMHMRTFNPVASPVGQDWLYGMAPAQALRRTIGEFDAAEAAQGTLFKNMGPGGIISGTEKGSINQAQGIMIQDQFVQRHTGLLNGGGLVVTPAQLTYQEIGMSAVDLNLIEAKGDLLQEICAVYNYPKERITGSQNTASQGLADKQVITSCVMPLLRDFDDSITRFIRQAYNDNSLVYISDTQYYPELQEDRYKLSQWLSQAWWIKVNEKRVAMDYDEDPDGDVMLIPSGLSKLQDITSDLLDPDIDLLEQEDALDGNNEEQ